MATAEGRIVSQRASDGIKTESVSWFSLLR